MIALTTPDQIAKIVEAYQDRPVTLVALLKEISYQALIPETKAAALAALAEHYRRAEEY